MCVCVCCSFLQVGTIEECIFQRQIKKTEFKITEAARPAADSFRHFSAEDLRDIFRLWPRPEWCRTYELLHSASATAGAALAALTAASHDWEFVLQATGVQDVPLQESMATAPIACVARKQQAAPTALAVAAAPAAVDEEEVLTDVLDLTGDGEVELDDAPTHAAAADSFGFRDEEDDVDLFAADHAETAAGQSVPPAVGAAGDDSEEEAEFD